MLTTIKPPRGARLRLLHPMARGMLGYWLLNEGRRMVAYDLMGLNDGALTNMEEADWIPGRGGFNLLFDGANEWVDLSSSSWLAPTSGLSVAVRAYRTGALASFDGLFSSVKDAGRNGGYIMVGTNANTIRFYIWNGAAWAFAETNGALVQDQVYDFLGTWDGVTVRLYLDGVLQTTTAACAAIAYPAPWATNHAIGLYPPIPNNDLWPGGIEYAFVSERALSAGEARWLHQEPYALVYPRWVTMPAVAVVGVPRQMDYYRRRRVT